MGAYGLGQAESCGEVQVQYAHVFICSASLFLLIHAFNPFTFKVVIDMYGPITIFLIVLGLFCIGRVLPFSCVFCLE